MHNFQHVTSKREQNNLWIPSTISLSFPKIIAINKQINLRGKQVFVSGNVNDVSQVFERKAKRLMELEGVWINIQYTVEANFWKETHEFDVLLCFI